MRVHLPPSFAKIIITAIIVDFIVMCAIVMSKFGGP